MKDTIEHNTSHTAVLQAPDTEYSPRLHQLFLAGGITNCPDWQQEMIDGLQGYPDLNIFNPKRDNYPMDDPAAAEEQIRWEYGFFEESTVLSFWFSCGSLNPIALYELGRWANSMPDTPTFIGIDPGYERTFDVIMQTKLARPDIEIVTSINGLAHQIKGYLENSV